MENRRKPNSAQGENRLLVIPLRRMDPFSARRILGFLLRFLKGRAGEGK